METYEEKYKDLVKRLNKAREEKGVYTFNSVLDAVAPELKIDESEYERIRKAIINLVETEFGDRFPFDGFTREQMLAWLEKQCEKDKFIEKELGCIKGYREKAIKRLEELEKQGEQKPADNVEPMSLNEAIEHCKEKSCGNNACALEHKQLEKWLIELKELKEKKPWGEEDEQMYNTIVNSLNRDQVERVWNTTEEEVDNWLKSIKDRVQPQPRQEWSEGDKRIIDNLISQLGNLYVRKLIKEAMKDE